MSAQIIKRWSIIVGGGAFLALCVHLWATSIVNSQGNHPVYLPLIQTPSDGVDIHNRQSVLDFYNTVFLASIGTPIEWTGSQAACNAGTTSQAYKEAVLLRINYFRAMAGVPAVVELSDEYNQKAQQAALMMSANDALDHDPPTNWDCYTADGGEGAGSSNLALGITGWDAILAYMEDFGGGNYFIGHRRWVLYPQTQLMGTGDIPSNGSYDSAHALWVFDENIFGPRPETREAFVAWPPPGYVPYNLVFDRWSFSYDDADFSAAEVVMEQGGGNVSLTVNPILNGYGENTLVWEPQIAFDTPPATDTPLTVHINNVFIGNIPQSFTYEVIVFDTAVSLQPSPITFLGVPPFITE